MDELLQMQEVCTKMAAKLESREIVPDGTHVAQLWHCMVLLCHHIIEAERSIASDRKVR